MRPVTRPCFELAVPASSSVAKYLNTCHRRLPCSSTTRNKEVRSFHGDFLLRVSKSSSFVFQFFLPSELKLNKNFLLACLGIGLLIHSNFYVVISVYLWHDVFTHIEQVEVFLRLLVCSHTRARCSPSIMQEAFRCF